MDHTYGDFRARREATVWQRLNRILRVLLVLAIWLVIVSLFVPPYKKLMQSRAEIDNLQQQVNEQQNLLARQTREVNLLKTDATYLETIARDRLDLMKEGETIFRLEPRARETKTRQFCAKIGLEAPQPRRAALDTNASTPFARFAHRGIELVFPHANGNLHPDAEDLKSRVRELRRFL